VRAALDDLQSLAARCSSASGGECRLRPRRPGGYAYYSGARFAIYTAGSSDAIARGGRYDEVGARSGATGPPVGFSLDVKELAALVPPRRWPPRSAPRGASRGAAHDGAAPARQGETVVCILPGHEHEGQEFDCDRELVAAGDSGPCACL
jgi:ATP phosphoribosyltransferase regulatory subunit